MHAGPLLTGKVLFPSHRVFPPAAFAHILSVDGPHRFLVHLPAPQIRNSIPHKKLPLPTPESSNLDSQRISVISGLTPRRFNRMIESIE